MSAGRKCFVVSLKTKINYREDTQTGGGRKQKIVVSFGISMQMHKHLWHSFDKDRPIDFLAEGAVTMFDI